MPSKASQKSHDYSAIAKLIEDFGLLLLSDSFERHLNDQSAQKRALRQGIPWNFQSSQDAHSERFIPLLVHLGIDVDEPYAATKNWDAIERLENIDNFVTVLTRTTDFTIEVSQLYKRLKRKFEGSNSLRMRYKTERLITEKLANHCRDIMWIVHEFRGFEDDDETLWDVNLWTVILDADRLHRETGMVHSAFVNYLDGYQSRRGGGSPRIYRRAALAVLLAECFEDFGRHGKSAQIHDKSEGADWNMHRLVSRRRAFYDSAFARFLIAFCKVIDFAVPSRDDNSLDKYRKMLRRRTDQNIPRLTERIKQGMKAEQVVDFLKILDSVKA